MAPPYGNARSPALRADQPYPVTATAAPPPSRGRLLSADASLAGGSSGGGSHLSRAGSSSRRRHADPHAASAAAAAGAADPTPPAASATSAGLRRASSRSGGSGGGGASAAPASADAAAAAGTGTGGTAAAAATGEHFRVFLRMRPYLEAEVAALDAAGFDTTRSGVEFVGGEQREVLFVDERFLLKAPALPAFTARKRYAASGCFAEELWSFGVDGERVFGDEVAHSFKTQAHVFRAVNTHRDTTVVQRLFDGFNHCVVSYGAMNAGKTHTLFGCTDDPGLAPRFLEKLSAKALKAEQRHSAERMRVDLQVSLVRVWKEAVEDLLRKDGGASVQEYTFKTMGDMGDGVVTLPCRTDAELHAVIAKMHKYRKPSARAELTKDNRSHVVLTVSVVQTSTFDDDSAAGHSVSHARRSTLTLADLGTAGKLESESPQDAKLIAAAPQAVSRCLACLAARTPVPHRDSILTQILAEPLGGGCATTIVGCLDPNPRHHGDSGMTIEALRKMQSVPTRSVRAVNRELEQLRLLHKETHEVKKQIHQESGAVHKVKQALTERQVSLNAAGATQKRLQETLRERHAVFQGVDDDKGRRLEALLQMRRYRRALLQRYDAAIKAGRARKNADGKLAQKLQGDLESKVELERARAETAAALRLRVDTVAALAGFTDVSRADVTPIQSDEFDPTVEYLEKLLDELEERLQSRRCRESECASVLQELQAAVAASEDAVEAVCGAEIKVRRQTDAVRAERRAMQERLRKAGWWGDGDDEAAAVSGEAEEGDDWEAESRRAEELRQRYEHCAGVSALEKEEGTRRAAFDAACAAWRESLEETMAVWGRVAAADGAAAETTRAAAEAQKATEEAEAETAALKLELVKLEGERGVAEEEVEGAKLRWETVQEEVRFQREKELIELKYSEERKKREDEIELEKAKGAQELEKAKVQQKAQLEALQQQLQKEKEKGGCCVIS